MTREQQASKNYFQVNKGLNTEFSEIGFQDGFTTDEANYELLIDGSRRRRKGLAAEASAGTAKTIDTLGSGYCNQSYLWTNVGGNPDKVLYVFRSGDYLYFADADSIVSNGWYTGTGSSILLDTYRTDDATDALVQKEPLSFTQGRGYLIVSGPYIRPFYITYDVANDEFNASDIDIYIRDFSTIEDGTTVINEPTGTITASHRYNIRNRGWSESDMAQYLSDISRHPARSQIWYMGYRRKVGIVAAGSDQIAESDGTREWNSAKLDAEAFGPTSAPTGACFLSPFDTTIGTTEAESVGGVLNITTWTKSGTTTWTVTLTTSAAHGLSSGNTFTLSGLTFDYLSGGTEPRDYFNYSAWNGSQTATTGTTGSTLVFSVTAPPNFDQFTDQYKTLGQVDTDTVLTRSNGTDHGDSFKAVEFHAGRVFYAGMSNDEFNDYIMFSQVCDVKERFGKCYQEADPTSETFSEITPADGGHIVIPGIGGILNMVSLRNSLIVLSNKGVWEISGGRAGFFTADQYTVRKITETPAIGADAFVAVEDSLLFGSPEGLFIIAPNQYTGILEAQSVSQFTIQTLWNDIPEAEQKRMQFAYDSSMKRVYMMYGPNGTTFAIDTMLVYDTRIGAFFKYTFDTPTDNVLMTGLSLENSDTTSNNEKMKFIYEVTTTTVQVADFNQTSFDDWDGTNGPLPYMYTGWDNIGDFQRRRQAPVITVFQKRTETGFTEASGVYTAVNPSSTLMSGFWDWTSDDTNEATTNKITATQEVYRHTRAFAPSATTDLDGYPVVVTRNKLRGRGRVLQLKFEGATDKDSHLLGFTINYKVSRRK